MADHNAPPWVLILVALIGAIGVILAALLSRPQRDLASSPTANAIAIAAPAISTPKLPQACIVPQVERLDQVAAEIAISQLGLQAVKSTQYNGEVVTGLVLSQDPPSGKKLNPCKGEVVIVVSLGPIPTLPPPTETSIPSTSTPPMPTSSLGIIPFISPDDSNLLNPVLVWHPGESNANGYNLTLYPGALTLIAGVGTDQWANKDTAPLVLYQIAGNFETHVKIVVNPYQSGHVAGFGVRSSQNGLTWVRIIRVFGGKHVVNAEATQNGNSIRIVPDGGVPYSDTTVYFKIERQGSLFSFDYSANGSNWVMLKKDFVFEMPNDVQIYLVTLADYIATEGLSAQFHDFAVLKK